MKHEKWTVVFNAKSSGDGKRVHKIYDENNNLIIEVMTPLTNLFLIAKKATKIAELVRAAPELKAMVERLLIPSMVMLDDLDATMPSRIRFERMETHEKAKDLLKTLN